MNAANSISNCVFVYAWVGRVNVPYTWPQEVCSLRVCVCPLNVCGPGACTLELASRACVSYEEEDTCVCTLELASRAANRLSRPASAPAPSCAETSACCWGLGFSLGQVEFRLPHPDVPRPLPERITQDIIIVQRKLFFTYKCFLESISASACRRLQGLLSCS